MEVEVCLSHGWLFAVSHSKARRCPPTSARVCTDSLIGQWLAAAHLRMSRHPVPAAFAVIHASYSQRSDWRTRAPSAVCFERLWSTSLSFRGTGARLGSVPRAPVGPRPDQDLDVPSFGSLAWRDLIPRTTACLQQLRSSELPGAGGVGARVLREPPPALHDQPQGLHVPILGRPRGGVVVPAAAMLTGADDEDVTP